jgi:hypothetical protein
MTPSKTSSEKNKMAVNVLEGVKSCKETESSDTVSTTSRVDNALRPFLNL